MKKAVLGATILLSSSAAFSIEPTADLPHLTAEQTTMVAKLLAPVLQFGRTHELKGPKGEKYIAKIARLDGINADGSKCGVEIEVRPPMPGIGLPEAKFPAGSTVAAVSFIDPVKGIATVDDESVLFAPGPRVYDDGLPAEIAPPTYGLAVEALRVVQTRLTKLGKTVAELKFSVEGALTSLRIETVSVVRFDGKPLTRAQVCTFPLPTKKAAPPAARPT
jgi:hypothetical protein